MDTLLQFHDLDPAEAQQALDGLVMRGWIKSSAYNSRHRRWLVVWTALGERHARAIHAAYGNLACGDHGWLVVCALCREEKFDGK